MYCLGGDLMPREVSMRMGVGRMLAAMVGLAGCSTAVQPGGSVSQKSDAVVQSNGANLNGANLNGANLNGANLNGANLNGANLNGFSLGGVNLDNVSISGSLLSAQSGDTILSGADLIGVQLTGALDTGDTLTMRIDNVTQGTAPNDDIYYYAVSYEHEDGSWDSLCADDDGSPLSAIAVAGRWNYAQGVSGGGAKIDDPASFTFACQHAAIAKCMEWGYKPWATVNGVQLADHHQTCTRAVRADYCGDGTPHTVDGQLINIYDNVVVQADTENWLVEAEWTPDGARCFNPLNRSHLNILSTLSCFLPKLNLFCGATWHYSSGTKIMTETPLSSDTGVSPSAQAGAEISLDGPISIDFAAQSSP